MVIDPITLIVNPGDYAKASQWTTLKDKINELVDTINSNPRAEHSGQSGTITTSETTIASVSLTVSGKRPVLLIADFTSPAGTYYAFDLKEGATAIKSLPMSVYTDGRMMFTIVTVYMPSAAGTYTYSFTSSSTSSVSFTNGSLVVMEL